MSGLARRFVRAYEGREGEQVTGQRMTVYEAASGETEMKIGGSPAWRNNNPGNIRPSKYNKEQIGAAWGFAVFDSEEAGLRAMRDLLGRPLYARLTLEKAIFKYAPPSDSNPSWNYAAYVSERSGVGLGEVLGNIGEARLMAVIQAMTVFERSVVGRVKRE